jgi:hypothetical protein
LFCTLPIKPSNNKLDFAPISLARMPHRVCLLLLVDLILKGRPTGQWLLQKITLNNASHHHHQVLTAHKSIVVSHLPKNKETRLVNLRGYEYGVRPLVQTLHFSGRLCKDHFCT